MSEKANLDVLLLGSGGRESALAWKLSNSPLLGKLFIAPGNGGTRDFGTNVDLKPTDFPAIEAFVKENGIDMVFVGNEDPLVAGIRDYMAEAIPELLVVGPDKAGAALEGSKDFAKAFMTRHGIPTAAYRSFTADTIDEAYKFLETLQPPYVLKADGLAAGKGVLIIDNLEEARNSLREMLSGMFGASSATVVIEQFLKGIECSVFVLTDGKDYRILPVAKDYKRIGEGDTGLNTGGMGAVTPVKIAAKAFMDKVEERIVRPTIAGLQKEGIDYRGFIFLGLINVEGEPMVIEYNVRMGDPETEAVMLRLAADLLALVKAAAQGHLGDIAAPHSPKAAATVMAVSAGYPGSYAKGKEITGCLRPGGDTIVFHAGTKVDADGRLLTSGGRVLTASSLGDTLEDALAKSYRALADIHFDGKTSRSDIGRDVLSL